LAFYISYAKIKNKKYQITKKQVTTIYEIVSIKQNWVGLKENWMLIP